jgi:hypothetical protein
VRKKNKDEGITQVKSSKKKVTFTALSIDTSGYKFNRDEVNERYIFFG